MEANPSTPEMNAESLSWLDTWASALTLPTVKNFETIAADPRANSGKGFAWILISGMIAYGLNTVVQYLFQGSLSGNQLAQSLPIQNNPNLLLMVMACGAPVAAVGAVLSVGIDTGFVQWIARMLGGQGSFGKLVYVSAAYIAPMALFTAALSAVPYLWLLNIPVGIYGIYLNLIAVKALVSAKSYLTESPTCV